MRRAAVFFDKDGTLIPDLPFNVDPSRVQLMPGAGEALHRLGSEGWALFVVSNQPGIALGRFNERDLERVRARLADLFAAHGAELSGFYYCPHHPGGREASYSFRCACRKPEPGLLLRAAQEHEIDLSRSWMVGDILDDIEAGRRAGCRTILVDNGSETEWKWSALRRPHHVVRHLAEAGRLIALEDSLDSAAAGALP